MALGAAVNAWRETPIGGDALMNALEAAAPYIRAEGWDEGYAAGVREEQPGWTMNPYK